MKVAFLIPSLKIGGAERTVSLLSKWLSKEAEVGVCVFSNVIEYPVYSNLYVLNGARTPLLTRINLATRYYKFISVFKPDVVVSLLTKAHTLNSIIPKNKRVLWFMNYPTNLYMRHNVFSLIHHLKFLTIYRWVDLLLSSSEALKDALLSTYSLPSTKCKVLSLPIDMTYIKELSKEQISLPEEELFGDPTLINVGRLTWQKGQWHLLRIFKQVSHEFAKAKLLMVGGGSLYSLLKHYTVKLGLEGKVELIGPQTNVYKFLARSDVFCFPSIREGLPIAIIEALACGIPVLASDCLSGPREILAPGTKYKAQQLKEPEFAEYGVLMPVPDGMYHKPEKSLTWAERVWVGAIITLLQDNNLMKRYRQAGPIRAKDYDAPHIATKFMEMVKPLYNERVVSDRSLRVNGSDA